MNQDPSPRRTVRIPLPFLPISVLGVLAGTAGAQIPKYTFWGGNEYGNDVDYVGDVNGDGTCDFAIGIPRDSTTGTYAGMIEIRSGKTGQVLYAIFGAGEGDQFGSRVVAAGDVDGDGVPDIAGASLESASSALSGYVGLYSGATGTVIREIHGNVGDNGFGRALDSGVDVDGDGVCDVLVGAFASNDAYLYSARTGDVIADFHDDTTFSAGFGMSVAFVDDLDQDDAPDCLIGAPSASYALIKSSMGGQTLRTYVGASGSRFGAWVEALGDTDGDGTRDIAIGAPLAAANGPASGFSTILATTSANELGRVEGLGGFEWGSRIAAAGDHDLDGHADFAVGSPYSDLALLYSGKTRQVLAAFPGDGASFGYGGVLAGGSDCDGDGVPNLLVGSTGHPLSLPLLLTVKLFKECAGSFEWIGSGCGVPGGVTPRLDVSGCAKPTGWIALRVSGTNKPTPALVFLGAALGNSTMLGNCPFSIVGLAPAPLTVVLEPQTLGSAEKTLFIPIPGTTPQGVVYLQAVLPESGKTATTNVVRMTVE